MSHPSGPDELIRYLEGDLSPDQARELESRLASSAPLRVELSRLRELISLLGASDPSLAGVDLVPALSEALAQSPPPKARRASALAGGALVLLAASLAVLVAWPASEGGLRAKGSEQRPAQWAGVDVFRVAAGAVVGRTEGSLKATDALAFAYRNGGPQPFSHLMIFAVDHRGTVFWFYPEWRDLESDPSSLAIQPGDGTVELREGVSHDFTPGPLTLHALFTRRPYRVSEVEGWLAGDLGAAPEDALDQRLSLQVER